MYDLDMSTAFPPHLTIAQLQGNSLPKLVQNEIERMILDGQLLPGAKLTESTLADQLGVSRGPVRDCLLYTSPSPRD